MLSSRWGAAALLALAGCSSDSDPDVAGATSYSIAARDVLTLRAVDGATHESPVDLDPAVVQAYARDAHPMR